MLKIKRKIALYKSNKLINKISLNEEIWNKEKEFIENQNKIDAEKKELSNKRKEIKLPSWSKLLSLLLFINFTALEIFIGWVTIKSFALAFQYGISPDFTPLITLISAVLGETISYAIYSLKSKAENTKGGIVFETAMQQMQNDSNNDFYG